MADSFLVRAETDPLSPVTPLGDTAVAAAHAEATSLDQTSAAASTAAQIPPTTQSGKTKLRKKRGDASARINSAGSSTGRRKDNQDQLRRKQEQQSFRRRIARARWVACMFLLPLMVLLHRAERVEVESNGILTTTTLVVTFLGFASITVVNELFGTSHLPTYTVAFAFSVLWGSVILAIRDLIAARLLCMVLFGVCGGSLRYHWADDVDGSVVGSRRSPLLYAAAPTTELSVGDPATSSQVPAQQATSTSHPSTAGYSSGSTTAPHWSDTSTRGPRTATESEAVVAGAQQPLPQQPAASSVDASPPSFPSEAPVQPHRARFIDVVLHGIDTVRFLVWRKVGLGLCVTLGEVLGCALWVPNAWSDVIAVSWIGYAAVVLVPIVVYKCASWVSHVLVLVCGTRVNTADASRLLLWYWAVTTVLSLATLVLTVVWLLTSLVPYVWSLQVLVTPYSVIFELIAYESKEYHATNPYKEVAEVYRDHIDQTLRNSKEYFVR